MARPAGASFTGPGPRPSRATVRVAADCWPDLANPTWPARSRLLSSDRRKSSTQALNLPGRFFRPPQGACATGGRPWKTTVKKRSDEPNPRVKAREFNGDDAIERLGPRFSELYSELRERARRAFQKEPTDHTLCPTAVVHEVYLRLREQDRVPESRSQLLGLAALMMQRILIDHARRRSARRRKDLVTLEGVSVEAPPEAIPVSRLVAALQTLEQKDPEIHAVVVRRYLTPMTPGEIAMDLGISERQVRRLARLGRAFLNSFLNGEEI